MQQAILTVAAVFAFAAEACAGGPKVHVVVGPQAPKLEQFAAKELAEQLKQLFEAQVSVGDTIPGVGGDVILLGSPKTNPAIEKLAGSTWPKLTDQGHLLRNVDVKGVKALLVGGGSPVATLWAVYELGHRFGVRYTLHGDIPPAESPAFKLTGFDSVMEPALPLRAWRTLDASPIGLEAWGLADQKKLLGQLAKLKFNRIVLAMHPWQPFVDYEFKGTRKQTGVLFHGRRFLVGGDTAGRGAFRGAKEFLNPDFAGKKTYEETTQAGIALARGIIDHAHELGMTAGIMMAPLEFPREFHAALPKATIVDGADKLAIAAEPDDAAGKQLAATQIRAYLDTYPAVDALYLAVSQPSAFQKVVSDPALFTGKNGRIVETVIANIGPARNAGAGAALFSAGATARRIAAQKTTLETVSAKTTPSSLILPLGDRSAGVLPQLATRGLQPVVADLSRLGWQGFMATTWAPGDINLSAHYLARAGFDPKLTPQAAYEDWIDSVCGEGVAPRLIQALDMIEKAAATIDDNGPDFAWPAPDMVMRHYNAEPLPPWWKTARELYTGAMDEVYRANTRARDGVKARPYMVYHAKRLEFAMFYLMSLEALRSAGQAKAKGDRDKQLEQLEAATEAMYNGLEAYSEVARDPSDRGVIAVLNEYAYRPLRKELTAASKRK